MHASNTLPSRNDATGDRGTEFRNRIAPTIDETFDDTAEMQPRTMSCGGGVLARCGNRLTVRELISPVMTRVSCRVYRIKRQTNQVATMGLTSQAAAVAASDTNVEFSSGLLQTVLVCSLAKHTGVVV